jgi:GT2 family glycosyltransferase
MSTVSAIIPTWNRADLLRSILAGLRAQTRPADEIVVVDNGSTDDSAKIAQAAGATLIRFPENRGFAVAVNEGLRQAKSDWLLILNNDVELQTTWLETLVSTAESVGASFAVGKLLRTGEVEHLDGSWDLLSRGAYAWRCGYGKPDGAVWSERRPIFFAPMTAALFHRRVFEQIGYLDERFESYYEDVDFGVRCALAGIQGVYEPAAVAGHSSKTTLGKRGDRVYFLSARNQVLLLAKHYSAASLRRFGWPVLVGQVLSVLAAAKQGHLLAALRGKWAALRLWSSFRPRYFPEQVRAVLSESEAQIHSLQKQVGFDPYWRLYFNLVRSG